MPAAHIWKWNEKVNAGSNVEVTVRFMNSNPVAAGAIAEFEGEVYLKDEGGNVVAKSGTIAASVPPSSYKDITASLLVPSTAAIGTVYHITSLFDLYFDGSFMFTDVDEVVNAVEVSKEKKVSWTTYAIIGGIGAAAVAAGIMFARR